MVKLKEQAAMVAELFWAPVAVIGYIEKPEVQHHMVEFRRRDRNWIGRIPAEDGLRGNGPNCLMSTPIKVPARWI